MKIRVSGTVSLLAVASAVAILAVVQAQGPGDPNQEKDVAISIQLRRDAAAATDPSVRAGLQAKAAALQVAIDERERNLKLPRAAKEEKPALKPEPPVAPEVVAFPESEITVAGQPPPGSCLSPMTNAWRGRVRTVPRVVFAGSSCDTPGRGELIYLEVGPKGAPAAIVRFLDTSPDGPLTIEVANGAELKVTDASGRSKVFSLETRSWK